jgi:hypothetical protein
LGDLKALAREEDPKGSLERLAASPRRPSAGRAAYALLALETGLWLSLGRLGLAACMADRLVEEAKARDLEIWEPDLAKEAYRSALAAYRSQEGQAFQEKAAWTASRLAALDPALALGLPGLK